MRILTLASTAAVLAALAACAATPQAATLRGTADPSAVAELQPTKGNAVAGTVRFSQQGEVMLVVVEVTGLKPGQEHGFHIHEKGDCSSGDGLSAGGHFNPGAQPHGPQGAAHHAGDLPALKADSAGNAKASFVVHGLSIGAGSNDIVGRGLIVHASPDDYKTQPTGNAGARLACGVIAKG